MARTAALTLAAALIAAAPAASVAAKAPAKPAPAAATASVLTPAGFPVQRHTLPNGLVVLLHEDHSVPDRARSGSGSRSARATSGRGSPGSPTSSST